MCRSLIAAKIVSSLVFGPFSNVRATIPKRFRVRRRIYGIIGYGSLAVDYNPQTPPPGITNVRNVWRPRVRRSVATVDNRDCRFPVFDSPVILLTVTRCRVQRFSRYGRLYGTRDAYFRRKHRAPFVSTTTIRTFSRSVRIPDAGLLILRSLSRNTIFAN